MGTRFLPIKLTEEPERWVVIENLPDGSGRIHSYCNSREEAISEAERLEASELVEVDLLSAIFGSRKK